MKKSLIGLLVVTMVVAFAVGSLILSDTAEARRSMMDGVNATCGSSYGCGLCHVDPQGGGTLTRDGQDYKASGHDSCYFCPDAQACGGPACDSFETSCTDGVDNDCDNRVDCNDSDCSTDPACVITGACADFNGDRASCNSLPDCVYVGKTKTCEEAGAPPADCSAFTNLTECKSNGCRWSRKGGTCK